jgi:hypothetical protein
VAALVLPEPADACRVCFPLPKKSVADHLMACDAAVLAREDPKRPFHYATVEVLRGAAPKTPLELFLDSGTRRILNANPDLTVLLAKAGKGSWRRLAMVDKPVLAVLRDILKRAPEWQRPGNARFDYFAKLFGHKHPAIRELAHLEVARAPYGDIRRLGRTVPPAKIIAVLRDARYMEWWALHILLLGQSEDPRHRKLITETVRQLDKFSLPNHLSAWSTAYVEIEGEKAIEFYETRYFLRARTQDELLAVTLALSVHGKSGRTNLRDRIVASYRVLLEKHPSIASTVLDDLIAWERVEMVPYMQAYATKHARALAPDARLKLRRFASLRSKARDGD